MNIVSFFGIDVWKCIYTLYKILDCQFLLSTFEVIKVITLYSGLCFYYYFYLFIYLFFEMTSYLIRFFARSSEHYFVRINSICESKHGAKVALELRDSFDSLQNL